MSAEPTYCHAVAAETILPWHRVFARDGKAYRGRRATDHRSCALVYKGQTILVKKAGARADKGAA